MLSGGTGNDALYGGTGNDTLCSWGGNDTLRGEEGNDTLYGGAGSNILYGGAGSNILYGGAGSNILYGGAGADTFLLESEENWPEFAYIMDYSPAQGDKIEVGSISVDYLVTTKMYSTSQFSYDNNTGALFFEQTQIATLQPNLGNSFIPSQDIILI